MYSQVVSYDFARVSMWNVFCRLLRFSPRFTAGGTVGGGGCWKPGLIGQNLSVGEREGADTCMYRSSDASVLGTVL